MKRDMTSMRTKRKHWCGHILNFGSAGGQKSQISGGWLQSMGEQANHLNRTTNHFLSKVSHAHKKQTSSRHSARAQLATGQTQRTGHKYLKVKSFKK